MSNLDQLFTEFYQLGDDEQQQFLGAITARLFRPRSWRRIASRNLRRRALHRPNSHSRLGIGSIAKAGHERRRDSEMLSDPASRGFGECLELRTPTCG